MTIIFFEDYQFVAKIDLESLYRKLNAESFVELTGWFVVFFAPALRRSAEGKLFKSGNNHFIAEVDEMKIVINRSTIRFATEAEEVKEGNNETKSTEVDSF